MSHVEQVGAKRLWSVHSSSVVEPFAYIAQVDGTYRVEDVEDGDLGSRRTFDEAVALAERHNAAAAVEENAHTDRVLDIIAAEERAA